jgi:hypothetical protein
MAFAAVDIPHIQRRNKIVAIAEITQMDKIYEIAEIYEIIENGTEENFLIQK